MTTELEADIDRVVEDALQKLDDVKAKHKTTDEQMLRILDVRVGGLDEAYQNWIDEALE